MQSPVKRPLHILWLILPWLTVGALFAAEAAGFRSWLFKLLPSELSTMAQNNVGWGVLLVTFGSSFRWIYLRWSDRPKTVESWIMLLLTASSITIAHACVAAGILFAGCMVVMALH